MLEKGIFKRLNNTNNIHRDILFNFKFIDLNNKKLIDIGCGDNHLLKCIKKIGDDLGFINPKYYGVDIQIQPERGLHLLEFDLNRNWLLPSNCFDVVVSTSTIEHLENPYRFMREASRIMKTGGYLLISTHRINDMYSRLVFLKNGWLNNYKFPLDTKDRGHLTPVSESQLVYAAKIAGLNTLDKYYLNNNKDVFYYLEKNG